jgi:mono/diheme cytochrome c family protein
MKSKHGLFNVFVGRGLLALGLCSPLLLGACGESEESVVAPEVASDSVTYGDVAPMITMRCGICHIGGGTGPELGGWANLSDSVTATEVVDVMENGSMPPGGPRISVEELQRMQKWVGQGRMK